MLTDLRLRKYLEGKLPPREAKELEILLKNNPALQQRLEELEAEDRSVTRPMWRRILLEKKDRKGSRVRYTTLLPALLLLMIVLAVSGHWFARPGTNSTFTLSGGTGSALELLYDSKTGWRYLDAGFRPGDSLTFAVHDAGAYYVTVAAIYGEPGATTAVPVWKSGDKAFAKNGSKPVFALKSRRDADGSEGWPRQIMAIYDTTPVPDLASARITGLLASQPGERGEGDFRYQVFSARP